MRKTHDYHHHYRGYWSEGGVCCIQIYEERGQQPVVICSQLPENKNTSVTNMAEYIAAEVIERHELPTPLIWIEHYPEHAGKVGEYSLVRFSGWRIRKVCLGGVRRPRIGKPSWSYLSSDLSPDEASKVAGSRSATEQDSSRVYGPLETDPARVDVLQNIDRIDRRPEISCKYGD